MEFVPQPGTDADEMLRGGTRFVSDPQVTLGLSNDRCMVLSCPPEYLTWLDSRARYPTEMVSVLEGGFRSPEAMGYGDEDAQPAWDGWVRMLRQPKKFCAWVPGGLVDLAGWVADQHRLRCVVLDTRIRPELGVPKTVQWEFKFREYQKRAVEEAVRVGRGVLDLPPRAGKTALGLEIQRRLAIPTLWTAPTDQIVTQTYKRALALFGVGYVRHQVGSRTWEDAAHTPLVICTAATAVMLPQEFYNTRKCMIIDEFHHGASTSYGHIARKASHIYYRFGMTGTFFRSGNDDLEMHGILSNTLAKIESAQLLQEGVLVPTRVVFVPIEAKLKGVSRNTNFTSGVGREGIYVHKLRNQLATYAAQQLVRAGRRVLVLVATKAQGRELKSLIAASTPPAPRGCEFKSVEFVSTDTDRHVIARIKDSFTARQEVQVLIGTSLIGEGVDLPAADALVYATGGKAEVSLTQNAYRVCTADEGKREAFIIDFADRHHSTLIMHSLERVRVYNDDPVFRIDALRTSAELPQWFAQRLPVTGV